MEASSRSIPTPFIWRRVHSLMGLWLVLYLLEHFLVNSQAALWVGDDGIGFVRLVNSLESLPYLQVLETVLIGVPILIHGGWGIKRALTAKSNVSGGGGAKPVISTGRNRAYAWQRITSWILLFGIVGHVIQMRFVDYPIKTRDKFMVRVWYDQGLDTLAPRLDVDLLTQGQIAGFENTGTDLDRRQWLEATRRVSLKDDQVLAVAKNPGTAMLLTLRDTFKNPWMAALYTIFVLAAAFHACNGFWTFLISWGLILSYPAQRSMRKWSWAGVVLLSFLGLAAIWGSYWNLRV